MEIQGHDLSSVSFPDFAVLSWLLDAVLCNLAITTDGAFLDDDQGQRFSRASLSFANWDSLSVRRYDAQTETWEHCSYDYDELKDICEFDISGEAVTLRGFGRKGGHWMEVRIVGGTASSRLD